MSTPTWGLDPKARRISVYYFGTSTIYEGMPVCYDNSTTNWMGVDGSKIDFTTTASTASLESTTTADGYQNEGKYIRVENPNADNVGMFAGVVAGADHAGETGPLALDIYVANGAVVPVRTDSNCLIDQTILAITTGNQELGVPLETDSRAVAIARETVDRGTAGLVLAELCPQRFVFQDSGGTALSIDDADTTTGTMVNRINVKFLGTSGYQKGLYATGEIAAAGGCAYGMFKFRTYVSAALSADAHTLCANLHLKDDAELVAQGNPEYASSPLYLSVETEYTAAYPDLSGGNLAAIYVGYYVNESVGAPAKAHVICCNSSLSANMGQWDGLLRCKNAGDVGDATVANATTQESASDRYIPIEINTVTYYLRAYVTAQ